MRTEQSATTVGETQPIPRTVTVRVAYLALAVLAAVLVGVGAGLGGAAFMLTGVVKDAVADAVASSPAANDPGRARAADPAGGTPSLPTAPSGEVPASDGGSLPAHSTAEYLPNPKGVGWAGTYRCTAGARAVTVPVTGQTVQAGGASFVATATHDAAGGQERVTIEVTLGSDYAAPTMIITPAAHRRAPDLWDQFVVQLALGAGATGRYQLASQAYAQNSRWLGIAELTFCMVPA